LGVEIPSKDRTGAEAEVLRTTEAADTQAAVGATCTHTPLQEGEGVVLAGLLSSMDEGAVMG
jgi:hypothetical protein